MLYGSQIQTGLIGADTITYTNNHGCTNEVHNFFTFGCQVIKETTNYAISLHPNPTTDLLYTQTQGIQAPTTHIYDVNGQRVTTMRFAPQVDVSNLAAGVYLIEVSAPEGAARRRFVKGP